MRTVKCMVRMVKVVRMHSEDGEMHGEDGEGGEDAQ